MRGANPDVVDWAAAGLFAFLSVAEGFMGILLMVSLYGIWLGVLLIVVAALLWYSAKGVFSRETEAWWVGFLLIFALIAVVPFTREPLAVLAWPMSPLIGVPLLVYLIVRRGRYGIGVVRGTGYESPSKGT